MKIVIILGIIFASLNLFGQSDSYYWYKGEKVHLKEVKNKKFVLYESRHEDQVIADLNKYSLKVLKKYKDNSISALDKLKKEKEDLSWLIVEKQQEMNGFVDSFSKQVLYVSSFLLTQDDSEVGLSHLFYVKLKNAGDIKLLEGLAVENNVEILGKNKFMPLWYTLACSKDSKGNSLEMANLFYESGRFHSSEPDLMADKLVECVDDDYFSDQWNLSNTAQYGGTSGTDINICDAWDLVNGCNNVIVAVLDHGFELNHPDLTNVSALSYDTPTATSPSMVRGDHGTACAGIIGATADNNQGIAGVASGCQLMSVSHPLTLTINARQELADGINWAWQNGADIISNSWGHTSLAGAFIDDAIDNALTQGRNNLGCVVVFATGNDDGAINYPANSNLDIIAVGAMSPCGERKNPNSCDGEDRWGSNYGTQLDVVAPGVLIPTTDRQGNNGYNPNIPIHTNNNGNLVSNDYTDNDYTVWFNGTSSACPQVAGVAALILSVNPGLTQDEVRDAIESTCTKVGNYNYSTVSGRNNGTWDDEVGYGCINAHAAVLSIYPSLSGPSIICSSGASFSLSNLPPVDSITWEPGPNLSLTSGQNTSTGVFSATGSGSSWVDVTLNTVCGDISLPRKTVYAGTPDPQDIDFVNVGPYYPGSMVLCEDIPNDGIVRWDATGSILEYSWSVYDDGSNSWQVNQHPMDPFAEIPMENVQIIKPYGSVNGWVNVKVKARNACGWGNYSAPALQFSTNTCYPYLLSLSPNPSTVETTISVGPASAEAKSTEALPEWDLEIYNQGQQLKARKQKIIGSQTTLNTSGWKEGVYIIRAKVNGEVLTEKLVVKEQ
ncbi:S8 family serine peptidase [Sunxiuqinia sp. sy24]|uniref:S8 family serine peptidase n=1 Tax=Sunxiuqinia sp. sy24 TaxID=3461495 RepID=UPI0040454DE0